MLIIVFGLFCLGVRAGRVLRCASGGSSWTRSRSGYLGSVLVGMAFAAGWTPCIGPVLGGILSLAATMRATSAAALVLLGAYSAGLAVPFLLAAVALESFLDWFQRFRAGCRGCSGSAARC